MTVSWRSGGFCGDMVALSVARLLRKDELVVDAQADFDRDVMETRHGDSRRLIGG